jgi:hypothetical protein
VQLVEKLLREELHEGEVRLVAVQHEEEGDKLLLLFFIYLHEEITSEIILEAKCDVLSLMS